MLKVEMVREKFCTIIHFPLVKRPVFETGRPALVNQEVQTENVWFAASQKISG